MIRTATADDLEALRGVFRRSALHGESDRDWLLAHPHHLVWDGAGLAEARTRAAVVDGAVAGFATWDRGPGALELVDLFVDPPAMRLGLGRALMADLVEVARAMGVAAVEVTGNPNALAFYGAVGFVQIGVVPTDRVPAPRLRLTVQ